MSEKKVNRKPTLEQAILSPYTYVQQMKGQRHYIKLFFAFNHWLKIPAEKFTFVVDIFNMIYDSGSMLDDIQDNSQVRGVLPAAHCIFGTPLTINASFQMTLFILQKASNVCPEACQIIIDEYLETFRGQGTEIYWRDNFICPTEEEFFMMTTRKTGCVFKMLVRLLQLFSENKTDYSKLVLTLSNFMQIHDDYCNMNHQESLVGCPEKNGKEAYDHVRFCEDVTEGKFTLPIIHAMQTEYADQVMNILRQRTRDVNLKKYFVSLLEKAGSLQHARKVMAELDREVRIEVARHGGNLELEAILDRFIVDWQK